MFKNQFKKRLEPSWANSYGDVRSLTMIGPWRDRQQAHDSCAMVRSSACKSRCLKTIENTPKDWHRQITMLFQFQNVSEWASMGHPWASHPIISSTRETSGKATSSTYQQQLAYLEVLEPLHFFVPYCRGFRTHCGTLALTSKLVQDPSPLPNP